MGWNPFKRRKKRVAASSPVTMATAQEAHEMNAAPVGQATPPPVADATEAAVAAGGSLAADGAGTADAAVAADAAAPADTAGAAGDTDPAAIEQQVIDVLRTIYDPEMPVNIYDLGLIYGIDVLAGGAVKITMTLTSPGCPVAVSLPPEVEQKVQGIPAVPKATVEITWDPPWDMDQMSEAAKLQLGF